MTRSITHTRISLKTAGDFPAFSPENLRGVRAFHESFPQYAPTPLWSLPSRAAQLGLGAVYIKDESYRFGLNAFKVLGGSYAIGTLLSEMLEIPLTYTALKASAGEGGEAKTFITATDGNHGRGVAWTAREFGHKSIVYMPKGTVPIRLENIRAAGADASIIDGNYDDAVRLARKNAEEKGWLVVQDTGWPGYEQIPERIMQGYSTMGLEAWEQLPEKPTHIFLQAGVGSMAAAMAALFWNLMEEKPRIIIVEPQAADCFFRTAAADDGLLHAVTGEMNTIMAGLACGEPCPQAWDILRCRAEDYICCPDRAAELGMRLLGNPLTGDPKVISGESGASAFGAAAMIMTEPELEPLRKNLGLDENARVLLFSTEGDTDPENYRKILGKEP